MIYFQVLIDSFIMLILCYALAGHSIRLEKSIIQWFLVFHGLCLLLRFRFTVSPDIWPSFEMNNFDLLPVDNPVMLLVLLLVVLILNSLLIKPLSNMNAVVLTLQAFLIWILLRTLSISATGLIMDSSAALFPYFHRIVTLLLATLLYYILIVRPGNVFIDHLSGVFTKIMLIQSSLAVLAIIIYANFETSFVLENLWFILIIFLLVISINIWIIYESNKISIQDKRFSAIERYLPVIDELVTEVQARQHEFHNKLLAVHSIVETSVTLVEAQSKISVYTKNVMMQSNAREILQMDSKVIGGFLQNKMRMAELKKLKLTTRIHAHFNSMVTEEHLLIEIIGVLMDNALEASFPGDEIILIVQKSENHSLTEISVMNPYPHQSNTELMQIFAKGYTTKNRENGARGYGLYNMKRIVIQQKGKIITRSSELNGIPYISIGVLIP